MKKFAYSILGIGVISAILFGCTQETKGEGDSFSIESEEEISRYVDLIKVVDKETGCKYIVTHGTYNHDVSIVQMKDSQGNNVCK